MPIYCKFCGAASTSLEVSVCQRCGHYFDGSKTQSSFDINNVVSGNKKNKENKSEYHLPAGANVGSIYTIESLLGEGGFGITYKAVNLKTGYTVAIKELYCKEMLHRNICESLNVVLTYDVNKDMFAKTKRRFIKEARTLMNFSGEEGIVHISDYFEDNDTAYLVMNYLDGITLKEYIERKGKLQWRDAFMMLKPVMESLSKIHSSGLIHRDISSSNIMVLQDNSLVLLDFGASKMLLQQESYTNMSIFAKKGYTPIEQYSEHGNIGAWTDVYAVAAVFYECITGFLPPDSLQRVMLDEYQTIKEKGVVVPKKLEQICERGLAVKPDERFQSISDFFEELHKLFNYREQKKQRFIHVGLFFVLVAVILLAYCIVTGMVTF